MRYSPAYSGRKEVQPELWLSNTKVRQRTSLRGLARADTKQSCRVIHAPYLFVMPKTRRLLRRDITWSAAKKRSRTFCINSDTTINTSVSSRVYSLGLRSPAACQVTDAEACHADGFPCLFSLNQSNIFVDTEWNITFVVHLHAAAQLRRFIRLTGLPIKGWTRRPWRNTMRSGGNLWPSWKLTRRILRPLHLGDFSHRASPT